MANLTKSERHNRMLENTFTDYRNRQNQLPGCHLYGSFLEIAEEKLHITQNEARAKYGQYTVKQWETLLQLGWNKN